MQLFFYKLFSVRSFYNDTDICKNILPAVFDGRADFLKVVYAPDAVSYMDAICYNSDETFGAIADIYKLLGILFREALIQILPTKRRCDQESH